LISIVVPTISGREELLSLCRAAYLETTECEFEFLIVENAPTCNAAWNIGLKQAKGDILHLSADDLEPHPHWDTVGLYWLSNGYLPCPRVLNTDGSLQSCGNEAAEAITGTSSDVARVPLFPRSLLSAVYPILDTQYMGDYWVTAQARKVGWDTVVVRDFVFTHHMAQEGRLYTLAADYEAFLASA